MSYTNKIRGDPGRAALLPILPSITETPADHLSQRLSFSTRLWQHSHTEKVAHVTHSLQGCCPQKYHSLECARQLYQNIVWNILTRLRISGQINNLHICVENCYQFWLQVLHLVQTLGHLYWAPGCDLSLPHKCKIEHTSLKLKSALCLCVDAMCHECAVQLEYVITLATLCLLCNFQIKPFVLSQT